MPPTVLTKPAPAPSRRRGTAAPKNAASKILVDELLRMRMARARGAELDEVAERFGRSLGQVTRALGAAPLVSGPHGCGVPQRCGECGTRQLSYCFECLVREGWIYDPPVAAEIDFARGPGGLVRRNVEVVATLPDRSELLVFLRAGDGNCNYIRTPHWLPASLVRELPAIKGGK